MIFLSLCYVNSPKHFSIIEKKFDIIYKMSETEFTDIVTGVGDILDSTVCKPLKK